MLYGRFHFDSLFSDDIYASFLSLRSDEHFNCCKRSRPRYRYVSTEPYQPTFNFQFLWERDFWSSSALFFLSFRIQSPHLRNINTMVHWNCPPCLHQLWWFLVPTVPFGRFRVWWKWHWQYCLRVTRVIIRERVADGGEFALWETENLLTEIRERCSSICWYQQDLTVDETSATATIRSHDNSNDTRTTKYWGKF